MADYSQNKYSSDWGSKSGYLDKDVAIKIVPSPVGGWDALSPLAAMDPKYAAAITNWVPRTGWLELRGGFNTWCQGFSNGNAVNTLMVYRPKTGSNILFAAVGTEVWDVSNYGMPVISLSARTSSKFQYINFNPGLAGVNYLIAVNGSDTGFQTFNGATWNTINTSGGPSPETWAHINVFKRRIWLIPTNSTIAYYLGTDAISGTVTGFNLGSFMTKGGFLMAMGTWTIDGGNGPDDLAVFYSSEGQAIIYKGTDPDNANAWALVGVFDLPKPIGRRCLKRLGSDLMLITEVGVLPLSASLPYDPAATRTVAITNRIQNAMNIAVTSYQNNFGWEFISFPQQMLYILNIPQVENNTQVQYVQNALTGAWTQFTGWNANTFEIFNGSLYFGGNDGNVNLAYAGGLDVVSPIFADVKCAFNYLDEPGRLKNAGMIRPFLVADGTLTPTISIDVDFADALVSAPVTILTPSGALWDVSLWDQSTWSSGIITVINWLSCNALGTALAVRMVVNLVGGGASSSALQGSVFDTGVFDTAVFDGNGVTTRSGIGIPTLQIMSFELSIEYGGPV